MGTRTKPFSIKKQLQKGLITFVLLYCSAVFAQSDPQQKWLTLNTENFTVIVPERLALTGQYYAKKAEQARALVSTILSKWPRKTILVIDDFTDSPNGLATPIPYPTIRIYPVLPSPLSSIGFYSDWSLELLIHEFTHIATFESASGFSKYTRSVFGSIVSPNILLPRWWLEGIAVVAESQLSPAGRLRSPYTEAVIRGLIEDEQLGHNSLHLINESFTPCWPSGHRPYLLGGVLINNVPVFSQDNTALDSLTQEHSGHMPYTSTQSALRETIGINYTQLLDRTYRELQERHSQNRSPNPPSPFLNKKTSYSQITISPDGMKLAFISSSTYSSSSQINIIERSNLTDPFDTKKQKVLFTTDGISQLAWGKESKELFFNRTTTQKKYNFFSDIYRLNIKSLKTKRITYGQRVREFNLSKSGDFLIYTSNNGNQISLKKLSLEADKTEAHTLHTGSLDSLISSPIVQSEKEILFLQKDPGQNHRFYKLSIDTDSTPSTPTPVKLPLKKIHKVKKSSNGFIITSSQSGLLNLYLLEENLKRAKPLTDTSTGVLDGDLDSSNSKLYFSRINGHGVHLYQQEITKKTSSIKNKKHLITPPLETDLQTSVTNIAIDQEDYSPWSYLIPRYWIPFIYPLEDGVLLQALTSSKDPLNRHIYSLQGEWNSQINKLNMGFQYSNYSYDPSFHLNYSRQFDQLLSSQEVYEINGGSLLIQKTSANNRHQISGGWSISHRISSSELKRSGPTLSYSYSKTSTSRERLEPVSGHHISISHVNYLKDFSDLSYGQSLIFASKYFKNTSFELRGIHSSEKISPIYGGSTANAPYQASLVAKNFLMRGYPSSEFLFPSGINTTINQHFPIRDIYRGVGELTPLFIKRLHLNLFVDSLLMEGGAFYSQKSQAYTYSSSKKWFHGVGAELNADSTLGYHLPVTFFWGLYYGLEDDALGGLKTFIGLKL